MRFKDLQPNTKTHQVCIEGDIIKLGGKQYELLEYLMNNRNTIVTKEQGKRGGTAAADGGRPKSRQHEHGPSAYGRRRTMAQSGHWRILAGDDRRNKQFDLIRLAVTVFAFFFQRRRV
ncbi:hypothetical protein [Brevibacillus massiliensis]|uniref:hypothetical protein n=1 Tax=Brevibacillus massiliensis TaxID=1118054 RepID=UPI0003088E6D|nr:hypothetical protein [Brevibacillus massiliensis]